MRLRRRRKSGVNELICAVCGFHPCQCIAKNVCPKCQSNPCACAANNINNNHIHINIEDLVSSKKAGEIKKPSDGKGNKGNIICQNLCGNISLHDEVNDLEIWRKRGQHEVTGTVSIFNSHLSTEAITVYINRVKGERVELIIPPGNTLTTLVSMVESIIALCPVQHKVEGTFCIELCFPLRTKRAL